jgi:hypothetical protein
MEVKMDLARVHKKVAEAHFFLGKMTEQEPRIIGDKEPFDHYLSAFLSAAMSVRGGFHVRQNRKRHKATKAWREAWENNHTPDEKQLYEFMRVDRVAEVHNAGSQRTVAQEGVKFGIGTHHIDGCVLTIDGIPTPLSGMEFADVCYRPTYSFIIDGTERKVTEACATYLALLQRMVAQFEADHP